MSYGDGGFYFLQPVNNGYGAIALQSNPYGDLKEGKKFGRYQMLYQPKGNYSVAQKGADLKKLKALRSRLLKDNKKAKKWMRLLSTDRYTIQGKKVVSAKNPGLYRKKIAKDKKFAQNWLRNIELALGRVNRNIKVVEARTGKAKPGILKKAPRIRTPEELRLRTPGVEAMVEAQGMEEFVPSGDEFMEEAVHADLSPEAAAMRIAEDMPSDLELQAEAMGIPEMEPGFIEKHRTLLMVGLLAGGAYTVYRIVR